MRSASGTAPSSKTTEVDRSRTILEKTLILLIQTAILPRPRHPPFSFNYPYSSTTVVVQFTFTVLRTDSGVSLFNGCRLPISRIFGRKSWTQSSWGKKSIFPWISHAVQLARVSPLLETPSLTSSHPSPGRRSQTRHYWIVTKIRAGWVGAG